MARSKTTQRDTALAQAYDAALRKQAAAAQPRADVLPADTAELRSRLDDALAEMSTIEQDGTARSSLAHAVSMIRVWSLRFQIANRDHEAAVSNEDVDALVHARAEMRAASAALEVWEKRKSAAISDRVNDLLLEAQEHSEEQDAIAARAQALQ